jgi:hypothetical protein
MEPIYSIREAIQKELDEAPDTYWRIMALGQVQQLFIAADRVQSDRDALLEAARLARDVLGDEPDYTSAEAIARWHEAYDALEAAVAKAERK